MGQFCFTTVTCGKGIVQPKMEIQSLFTHHHVVTNLYDLISSLIVTLLGIPFRGI